jgi:hypothetical protein
MEKKVLGLTETGETVTEMPAQTDLPLGNVGQYYNEQVPIETTFQKNANKIAGKQFKQNVTNIDASAARGASELQSQGQQFQTQLSLGEYMRDQSAEKAGWTGGYMLDQARQGEYLKTSIQSQLYGAQELQKFGMETQLEAARAAYDLGKEQLALQYYNEAYQRALTEAQMFGYYVAPETRDMFNQYQAAQTALNANEDDANARRIIKTIEDFYGKEGLTPADIRTFSQTTLEMQQIMQGRFDAAMAIIEDDPSKFLVKNSDGSYATDSNGNYITLNFNDISKDDLVAYLTSDDQQTTATSNAQVKSFLRNLGQNTINGYLRWLEDNPNQVKDWLTSLFGEDASAITGELGETVNVNLTSPKGNVTAIFNLTTGEVTIPGVTPPEDGITEEDEFFPTDTTEVDGAIKWNSTTNKYEIYSEENESWINAGTEEVNQFLNDIANNSKDLDGKKIVWSDWYNAASVVSDGQNWNWGVQDYVNAFKRDQEYITALNEGNIPPQFTGEAGWRELLLFTARNVPSGNAEDTRNFLKNVIVKGTGLDPDTIEIEAYQGFPSIKIGKTAGNEWLSSPGDVAEANGKYVFYTQIDSGANTTGFDISGTGVNDVVFNDGTGLNDKWLNNRFGDYTYLITQMFSLFANR